MEFEHDHARLGDVTLHYVSAGAGDPVVLLHGWPSTWYEWRHVIPALAAGRRVIAPDLRGLGDSSRPLDISQGGKRWHHAFHMTADLPEALVRGRERNYLSWFYDTFSWQRGVFDPAAIDEYLRTYTQPGALRAGFDYYRNIPRDSGGNRALLAGGLRLKMPVLAIGGGRTKARGRRREPEESLRQVADDVTGAVVVDCGHFVPEERPEELAALLLAHFDRAAAALRSSFKRPPASLGDCGRTPWRPRNGPDRPGAPRCAGPRSISPCARHGRTSRPSAGRRPSRSRGGRSWCPRFRPSVPRRCRRSRHPARHARRRASR